MLEGASPAGLVDEKLTNYATIDRSLLPLCTNDYFLERVNFEAYRAMLVDFAESLTTADVGRDVKSLSESLGEDHILAPSLCRAAIRRKPEDMGFLEGLSNRYGIDVELLVFLALTPLVPAFHALGRALLGEERYVAGRCPLCCSGYVLAVYRGLRRYLACWLCGTRVRTELLCCVLCECRDPAKLGFMRLEEEGQFQLDYCLNCNHFLKAVDEDVIGPVEDFMLLDLATLDLDSLAREKGLESNFHL